MNDPTATVVAGRILSSQGTNGELKVEPWTDFPERFAPGKRLYVGERCLAIEGIREHKGRLILKLETVNTRQEAQALQGKLLEIRRCELPPLPEGDYYWFQIIGLEVWTTTGELVGEIVDIIRTPSNDVYAVRGAGREVLIPAIEDVIQDVDVAGGRIVVEAIEGLLNG